MHQSIEDAEMCHCHHEPEKPIKKTFGQKVKPYTALIITLIGIIIFGFAAQYLSGYSDLHVLMHYLMAGYFLAFGSLQLISLKWSARMLQQYEPIAMRWKPYGYIYPFIQFGLGLAFLFWVSPLITNIVAALFLFITLIGIIQAIEQKKHVRCGCLGSVLKVEVGWVTLTETLVMLIMAFGMIVFFLTTMSPNSSHSNGDSGHHQHQSL